jgi:hypothetical protein
MLTLPARSGKGENNHRPPALPSPHSFPLFSCLPLCLFLSSISVNFSVDTAMGNVYVSFPIISYTGRADEGSPDTVHMYRLPDTSMYMYMLRLESSAICIVSYTQVI